MRRVISKRVVRTHPGLLQHRMLFHAERGQARQTWVSSLAMDRLQGVGPLHVATPAGIVAGFCSSLSGTRSLPSAWPFRHFFFSSIVRSLGLPAATVTVCSIGPVKGWYRHQLVVPGGTSVMVNLPSAPVIA